MKTYTLDQIKRAFDLTYQSGSHFFSGSQEDRDYRWQEFFHELDNSCPLICHDENHNGDRHPGQGCGNPGCWKHEVGNSPPKQWMTFNDRRCTCSVIDRMRYEEKLEDPLG